MSTTAHLNPTGAVQRAAFKMTLISTENERVTAPHDEPPFCTWGAPKAHEVLTNDLL